ncbi:4-aminobutyrate--2-oxoglutarate transaminase, partial [Auritidibacter sp. NML120779]
MSVEQSRHLVTELPGPKAKELAARQAQYVSPAVASSTPTFAAQAFGGIIE